MPESKNVQPESAPVAKADNFITPKELAAELGMDAKTLRRIMRSMTTVDVQPGSGGRWAIDAEAKAQIVKRISESASHRKVAYFVAKTDG